MYCVYEVIVYRVHMLASYIGVQSPLKFLLGYTRAPVLRSNVMLVSPVSPFTREEGSGQLTILDL